MGLRVFGLNVYESEGYAKRPSWLTVPAVTMSAGLLSYFGKYVYLDSLQGVPNPFPEAASSGPSAGSSGSGRPSPGTLGTPDCPSRRTDSPQFQAIFRSQGPNGRSGS